MLIQLKRLYTNAHRMGNKQEELEIGSRLLSQKHGGMSSTTGTLQLRATSFPEETGWDGGMIVVL